MMNNECVLLTEGLVVMAAPKVLRTDSNLSLVRRYDANRITWSLSDVIHHLTWLVCGFLHVEKLLASLISSRSREPLSKSIENWSVGPGKGWEPISTSGKLTILVGGATRVAELLTANFKISQASRHNGPYGNKMLSIDDGNILIMACVKVIP